MAVSPTSELPKVLYSCYHTSSREGEQFVSEHILSFQLAGTLTIYNGEQTYTFSEGDIKFHQRNHLLKFYKQPTANGEGIKTLSVCFDQETLRNFRREVQLYRRKNAFEQSSNFFNS